MAEPRPLTLATLAPVLFSLVLGGVIGVEIHKYSLSGSEHAGTQASGPSSSGGGGGGMMGGGGGGMGGGGGGMGGGGGASQPNSGRDLSRLVGSLVTVQNLQGKGLTADQESKLLPVLQAIKSVESLPEAEAKAKLDAVNGVLTPDQTKAIKDMTPQRGGRGGGGAGGAGGARPGAGAPTPTAGGPGGGGGRGGGGMSGGGGMGGGGTPQDPNKPFASERAKKALDDLIGIVQAKK